MAKHRISRVVTRQGDKGTTKLAGGQKVDKDHARIQAYGEIDELSATLGLAVAQGLNERIASIVGRIQHELFRLSSELCLLPKDIETWDPPRIEPRHIERLEEDIEITLETVPPLEDFVLRGGSAGAAALHLACTVCRRAERRIIALARQEELDDHVQPYINRLSDLLFVLARLQNYIEGVVEPIWEKDV